MKRFASKTPSSPDTLHQSPVASPLPDQTFDIQKLLDKSGTILAREVQNLLIASSGRKLDAAESRDLVAYIKLLNELRVEQLKELGNLTDSELADLVPQSTSD